MPAAAAIGGGAVLSSLIQSNSMDQASRQSAVNAKLAANYADPYHGSRAYWGNQLDQFMGKGGSAPLSYNDWAAQNGISTGATNSFGEPAQHSIFGIGGLLDTATPNSAQAGQSQQQYQDYVKNFQPSNPLQQLQNSPSYQFRYNQGLSALNSSLAAKGMLGSGNRLAALQNYGQDYASQEYGNQFNRLASLSGATNGQMGAAGQNFSSNAQNSVGYGVASNNAITSGLGTLAQQYGGGGTNSYNAGGTGGTMFNPGQSGANNAFNTGGSAFSDSSILGGL